MTHANSDDDRGEAAPCDDTEADGGLAARVDRLEELVEEQRELIESQREQLADGDGRDECEDEARGDEVSHSTTRRGALTAGGLLAMLGLGMGTASADAQGQVGTSSDPLQRVYTREINSGGGPLTVNIDGNRAVSLESEVSFGQGGNVVHGHSSNDVINSRAGTVGGGGFDDGSDVDPNVVTGDYGTVSGGRGNTASWAATVGGGQGNTANTFYSTVGGGLGNTTDANYATIGGGQYNDAEAQFSTIAGGGPTDNTDPDTSNVVYDYYGTVGGGGNNQAGTDDEDPSTAPYATVGGGFGNTASGNRGTVAGGAGNTASVIYSSVGGGITNTSSALAATIAGGVLNTANADDSSIGGGRNNTASGSSATIPGGSSNTADGDYSFAAGRGAKTNGHDGAFVFGDSSSSTIQAQNDDELRSQVPMHAPSFNNGSTREAKSDIEPVDPASVLEGVKSLPVSTWTFDHQDDGRHMGPMAEDFHERFGLGNDDESIATVDSDGVAFAAIQGLAEQNDELAVKLAEKGGVIDTLKTENAELRERVADLEERLARGETGESASAPADH